MVKKKKILIVGGGTAGIISALILKTQFDVDIEIIKSDKIGIIGVGEGSTEHFNDFLNFCGINFKELIKETDATIKLGVYFTNGWANKNYYHNIGSFKSLTKMGQINYGLLQSLAYNEDPIKSSDFFSLENLLYNCDKPSNQYHFNTFKLNSFLLKKCEERNIKVTEDLITDIKVNDYGIEKLIGTKNYTADFYLDCTGFKRLLISKLGAKWISYSKHLTMNEAIAFPTKDTDEYTPYTESKRVSAGWMWRIPTYGRWGNGYVYNSNLINVDEAKKEAEEYIGHEIEIGKNIKFDPGALDRCLIKNCLAVGLAANFVEPLEASSIGTTINQMFLFNHYFTNLDSEFFVNEYNNKMNAIMENIKEFVLIHYLNDKNISLTDTLKEKLNLWSRRSPIDDDFCETRFYLFFAVNFVQVLCGVNFYNSEQLKKYISDFNPYITTQLDVIIKQKEYEYLLTKNNHIGHKQWLTNFRNDNK